MPRHSVNWSVEFVGQFLIYLSMVYKSCPKIFLLSDLFCNVLIFIILVSTERQCVCLFFDRRIPFNIVALFFFFLNRQNN